MHKFSYMLLVIFGVIALYIGCAKEQPVEVTEPDEYVTADGYNGGKLYNTFWAQETGVRHADSAVFKRYNAFFRCVQCHGWDLLGREGSFASYHQSRYVPNVSAVNLLATAHTLTATELFHAIKTGGNPALRRSTNEDLSTYDPETNPGVGDRMPDFAHILDDTHIWDLVRFLNTEAVDVRELYDLTVDGVYPSATVTYSNIGKDGNAEQGKVIFDRECGSAMCHGLDGSQKAGMAGTIGKHLRAIPFQDGHIIKFGVPGTDMGEEVLTTQQLKDLFKALADSTMYP